MEDPRHRNVRFDLTSVHSYLDGYVDRLHEAVRSLDPSLLEEALRLIERTAATGNRVYAIGNGGSAAIADHLSCDWTKGTHAPGHPVVDSLSLAANVALYSAVANDFGFEHVFSTQLNYLGRAGDLLLAISSSGASRNVLEAVGAARALGMTTIGMTGFDGGLLKSSVDVALHIPVENYGLVEDAHQILMHVMAQFLSHIRDGTR